MHTAITVACGLARAAAVYFERRGAGPTLPLEMPGPFAAALRDVLSRL